MQYIDSHCHLHDSRINQNLGPIIVRAKRAGVRYTASCSTMEENFELTAQISQQYPSILPFFGIHPWFVDTISSDWKQTLETYLTTIPSGIGETGIDFTDKSANQDLQLGVFKYHLSLAKELELPINIHVRKAWDTFIHVLKKFGKFRTPGMIHSYSGSADMIPIFEKAGFYISFSGSVTNPGAKKVVSALKKVSQDRFVLETDTPDIYPYIEQSDSQGFQLNRLNEPANIPAIAQIASSRIGLDCEAFCENVYQNSKTLFLSIFEKREKE
ncbi:MAG: TatD family hydrolase [Desulfobacula sp.]|nr:TatD family hydrolase [Desulfobacula sp.]